MVKSGILDAKLIADQAAEIFSAFPEIKVDYISICDPLTLEAVELIEGNTLMALAVGLAKIRLIDNTILEL
jgi:pantoate--beta-alanine ligase